MVQGKPGLEQVMNSTNSDSGRYRVRTGLGSGAIKAGQAEPTGGRLEPDPREGTVQAHAQIRDAKNIQKPMLEPRGRHRTADT